MSYQVLARRWRPKTFAEMVGQTHIVQALQNALRNQQVHHAYLFTGTRGVGKTTLARILAKSLNCESGMTAEPCGTCSVCTAVDAGCFIDLIEVDAASKTGVDDTRELLDNVPYAPTQGQYKVYLIDEVHMFSKHSFNALLKTLEEPPPHIKFLLATTDPQKLPVTVLSRCLQFSLKPLTIEQITAQFTHIAESEQIVVEPAALHRLACAADGSMRDGLSLFDQAIAFGAGEVRHEDVRRMLGIVMTELLPDMILAIQRGDAATALDQVQQVAQQTPDFSGLLNDLMMLLHRISLLQAVPNSWQASWGDEAVLRHLADNLSPEDSQLYYQIAMMGLRDLPLAPNPQSGFEMTLLRMHAFRPQMAPEISSTPRISSTSSTSLIGPGATQPTPPSTFPSRPIVTTPINTSPQQAPPAQPAPQSPTKPPSPKKTTMQAGFDDWHQVVPQLKVVGMTEQLARHAAVHSWDGNLLTLAVQTEVASMIGSRSATKLEQAIQHYHGTAVTLRLIEMSAEPVDPASEVIETPAVRTAQAQAERQQQAERSIAEDPMVQAMQQQFDATIVAGTIKPLETQNI